MTLRSVLSLQDIKIIFKHRTHENTPNQRCRRNLGFVVMCLLLALLSMHAMATDLVFFSPFSPLFHCLSVFGDEKK